MPYRRRPRFTKHLDVWVEPSPENASRTHEALAEFGAPLSGIVPDDLIRPETYFQVGVYPNRVDVFSHLHGIDFASAWDARVEGKYAEVGVQFMSVRHLIAAKQALVDRRPG